MDCELGEKKIGRLLWMGTRNDGWVVGHTGTPGKHKLDARYVISNLCCILGFAGLDVSF